MTPGLEMFMLIFFPYTMGFMFGYFSCKSSEIVRREREAAISRAEQRKARIRDLNPKKYDGDV